MRKSYNQGKVILFTALTLTSVLCISLKNPSVPSAQELEVSKLVIKGSDGKPALILDASSGTPSVKFIDSKGEVNMELLGGANPTVLMRSSTQKEMLQIALIDDQNPVVSLKDANSVSRLQLQGGTSPALFLKNPSNEIIATIITLQDGGAAVGLADKEGDVATFLRGGNTPSVSFFQKSAEPYAALGISQKVPHLLVTSPSTKDNLVLHGGEPTSVLFVDDKGEIPVLLSKHGLFQGKKEASQSAPAKEDKIFTLDSILNPLKDVKLNMR